MTPAPVSYTHLDVYKRQVMSLSEQKEVDKQARKVMTDVEREKLKKTVFEIYDDYISPLQAQYSQLTEDDLLVLCLQDAGISPLAISLCFGHTDTVCLLYTSLLGGMFAVWNDHCGNGVSQQDVHFRTFPAST